MVVERYGVSELTVWKWRKRDTVHDRCRTAHRRLWNVAFFAGSAATALSQGFMLGMYIMGLDWSAASVAFAGLAAVFVTVGYSFIGATWLIFKAEGALQRKAIGWAKGGVWGLVGGIAAISLASPLASARIFEKWFSFPEIVLLAPFPLMFVALSALVLWALRRLPAAGDAYCWFPFLATVVLFVLAFAGLAYSFYPYVVPERLTIYEAAAAPESLIIILVGALVVLPMIVGYTLLSYTVFRGKATDLTYG